MLYRADAIRRDMLANPSRKIKYCHEDYWEKVTQEFKKLPKEDTTQLFFIWVGGRARL